MNFNQCNFIIGNKKKIGMIFTTNYQMSQTKTIEQITIYWNQNPLFESIDCLRILLLFEMVIFRQGANVGEVSILLHLFFQLAKRLYI